MQKSRTLIAPLSAIALALTAYGASAAEKGLWEREKLTGDWGGARSALEDRGVVVTLDYIGETLSILRGGLARGTAYEGRLDGIVNADLEKLVGWRGGNVPNPNDPSKTVGNAVVAGVRSTINFRS